MRSRPVSMDPAQRENTMRKRITIFSLVALLLMAALPGVAFAAFSGFTAGGAITQTDPGTSSTVVLEAARSAVSPGLFGFVESNLPYGAFTPGSLNPGQRFKGELTASDWAPLQGAEIKVKHNSWFTADLSLLATQPATPLIGLAWGTFEAESNDDELEAAYEALILGQLALAPGCASGLSVIVSDAGGFSVLEAEHQYEAMAPQGQLTVFASGCLFEENASFSISGYVDNDASQSDDDGDDDDDDDDDERGHRSERGDRD